MGPDYKKGLRPDIPIYFKRYVPKKNPKEWTRYFLLCHKWIINLLLKCVLS